MTELLGEYPDHAGDLWRPAVDIFETEDALVVRLEMAGVSASDLRVNVDGELLRIHGVRRTPAVAGVRRLHQMEIAFGPFETSIRLGIPFDRDGVSAHLEDGLLQVRLPKRRPTRVEVQVETE